jgi:holo-[acyl-carrier protein] synthase
MIVGIGIDIVEIDRVQQALLQNASGFSSRILTPTELGAWDALKSDARRIEYMAGRFAVKEAIAKAFGTGIGEISFHDIVVINDSHGRPEVKLSGNAKKMAEAQAITNVWVSISHSRNNAVAQAILEKKQA